MRETGIRDKNNVMVVEGDVVIFPHISSNQRFIVTFVGDGDDMDWAADKEDGTPDSWLGSSCEIINI